MKNGICWIRSLLVVSALLFGMRAIALGQADLTGYWKYSVPNGGVTFLELKQTGDAISGNGHGGPARQLSGTLHGDKLHLEIPFPFGPPNAKSFTVYDAVVKGDKFPATQQQPGEELTGGTL